MKVIAIVAMDENRVIGVNNTIPWHYSEDMKRFAALTTGHTVLMGRKTYESLPEKFRPLPKRKNVVSTRSPEARDQIVGITPEVEVVGDPVKYIQQVRESADSSGEAPEQLWVIGGEQIYRITLPYCDELFLTRVHSKHEGDAFFPAFENGFELINSDNRGEFSFEQYRRKGE